MKRRSHSNSLAGIGETTNAVTTRILDTWARATDADKESGALWYAEGEGIIDRLAAQAHRSREAVAAVVAHLSPRTRWARNIAGATSLILTGRAPGCLSANVERAIRAMGSNDPLATLNGPKVRRFALNLLGDRDHVTIDVWGAKVALDRDNAEMLLSRAGAYEAIEWCYQVAALRAGVDPATMQATTWIVMRNGRTG